MIITVLALVCFAADSSVPATPPEPATDCQSVQDALKPGETFTGHCRPDMYMSEVPFPGDMSQLLDQQMLVFRHCAVDNTDGNYFARIAIHFGSIRAGDVYYDSGTLRLFVTIKYVFSTEETEIGDYTYFDSNRHLLWWNAETSGGYGAGDDMGNCFSNALEDIPWPDSFISYTEPVYASPREEKRAIRWGRPTQRTVRYEDSTVIWDFNPLDGFLNPAVPPPLPFDLDNAFVGEPEINGR